MDKINWLMEKLEDATEITLPIYVGMFFDSWDEEEGDTPIPSYVLYCINSKKQSVCTANKFFHQSRI